MIYLIKQTCCGLKVEFQILNIKTEKLLFKGQGTRLIKENTIKLFNSTSKEILTLEYDLFKNLKNIIPLKYLFFKTSKKNYLINSISENKYIGRLGLIRKGLYYSYYSLIVNQKEFILYEIPLGKYGIKIPIFYNNIQIGLIEKSIYTENNKDEYYLYLSDDSFLSIISLFIIYYDNWEHGNQGEIYYGSKVEYVWTASKKIKSKYNPIWKENFIKLYNEGENN